MKNQYVITDEEYGDGATYYVCGVSEDIEDERLSDENRDDACEAGCRAAVNFLLDHDVDVEVNSSFCDWHGGHLYYANADYSAGHVAVIVPAGGVVTAKMQELADMAAEKMGDEIEDMARLSQEAWEEAMAEDDE